MNLDERNDALNKRIAETNLPEAVQTLVVDARRRRLQLRVLTISVLLDLLLTVGLAFISFQTHSIASQSESNQQALIRNCQTGNDSRAANKQLWHYLLSLPTPQATTLQQQQLRDQFSKFVDKTFAPRDCNSVVQ